MDMTFTNINNLSTSVRTSSEIQPRVLKSQDDNQDLSIAGYQGKFSTTGKIEAPNGQLQQVVIDAMCDLF